MNIYCDNAASTKVRQEVLDIMAEHNEDYGNPSCMHTMGQKSRELIDNARNQIAKSINAKPNEIIFTSSGTEANNLAFQGYAEPGMHIITTLTEHVSVLNTVRELQQNGCDVTYLPVDNNGLIDLKYLERSIRRNTTLISIIFANNEIGTIQPIKEIGAISKLYNICFHTDAVQALGHCNINVNDLDVDMMSISGHKIYAPKGVGALYVKKDVDLYPLFFGGGQEYGLRSGTENVQSIVGFGKAIELLTNNDKANLSILKNKLINKIKENIPDVTFNGAINNSLPNIVNVSFKGVDGESLAVMLSAKGIYVTSGAACSSGSMNPSHVLKAIGLDNNLAYSSLRFSFGMYNTEEDVDHIISILPELVKKLRKEAL